MLNVRFAPESDLPSLRLITLRLTIEQSQRDPRACFMPHPYADLLRELTILRRIRTAHSHR